jgi:hypothetical protein
MTETRPAVLLHLAAAAHQLAAILPIANHPAVRTPYLSLTVL